MSIADDIRNVIAEGEQRVHEFLDAHAPELERVTQVAAAVEADPLMQAAQAAVGLTPGMRTAIADAITRLDAELTRVAQEATENGRAAGVASMQAPPEQPADPQPELPADVPAEAPAL